MGNTNTKEESEQIQKSRGYMVVKSNKLINNVSRRKYELSVLEQRAIAYIISQIRPPENITSEPTYKITFDIRQFCKVCGMDYNSGKNYENVKAALEKLADNGFWIDEGDSELYFQWINTPRIFKNNGQVTVKISDDVMPYLWNLQERFTKYELYQILALKSTYSIAMYELLKCNAYKKKVSCGIDELKKYLSIEDKYKDYRDFKKRVIDPSIEEINTYTDLTITWEGIRKGRSYTALSFTIEQKEGWEGYEAYRRTVCELNGVDYEEGQSILFE